MKTILVTGGSGFIGSNFLNTFVEERPQIKFINVDKLTYAANPLNLKGIEKKKNYIFEHVDICEGQKVIKLFEKYIPDGVVHFAAESHVDKSIDNPARFIETNIKGTFNLLGACLKQKDKNHNCHFHHVSTDEVYGSAKKNVFFTESTAYDPSNPYSASKASADHLVRAYYKTYGLDITITNCSNNYGPYQFPEKLIPFMIFNLLKGKRLPVYGKGENVRDWLYVEDHVRAIMLVLEKGCIGETYNVGGNCEKTNLEVVHTICDLIAVHLKKKSSILKSYIDFVKDRPGHDLRYAVSIKKITSELGWTPGHSFKQGMKNTVNWYLKNKTWIKNIRNGGDFQFNENK